MKIKSYITITIVLLALAGCQLLKKDKLTLKTHSQKEELKLVEQRNTLSQKNQLVLIDSNHNDFAMMLWPKGKFKFSLTNGFEGEAEKVLIKDKHTRKKVLNLKQEKRRDSTQLKANYTNEKESSVTVKKDKLSVSYNWTWLLLVVVIFALIWAYRRFAFLIR